MADRPREQLRPIRVQRHFPSAAAGSVLWQQGDTVIHATCSADVVVPPWFPADRAGGWATANYVMLPGSTARRKDWPRSGHTDSRGTEIERLIGRSLRAALDLSKIGPHTLALDCHVLKADGGTRTAAICAAYLALTDALASLPRSLREPSDANLSAYDPAGALRTQIAAVSVGIIDEKVYLDLDYPLDSRAGVDLNVVMNGDGQFVEVQGGAELATGFSPEQLSEMLTLASRGCQELMRVQGEALNDSAED